MNVGQLRNTLLGVPSDAELYVQLGDQQKQEWAAYQATYDVINNKFYVHYMKRE